MDDTKYKSRFQLTRQRKALIKKVILGAVVVMTAVKLWQYILRKPPPFEEPPEIKYQPTTKWVYEYNSQGLREKTLKTLLDSIANGERIESGRTIHDQEVQTIQRLEKYPLKKVEKPYVSTGSLTFKAGKFYLDGKPFRILSGAMHYFRVMPEYWQDRMRKMKACGLNTVETYVSWNLHEDTPGNFNFDGILNIRKFIELAHQEGLYVILRPGPYICSEWDFGGMPAWLLKDPNMKVRTNYPGYKEAADRFFSKLIPLVADLQHTDGGPIIAVAVENEYGSYSSEVEHLMFLKQLLIKYGIKELLFVADGIVNKELTGFNVAPFYDETLPTVNFMKYHLGKVLVEQVKSVSKDFPIMVMEFWAGWFDHWEHPHAYAPAKNLAEDLQNILESGASVNFYMFHGGTNFGFTAGANWFNDSNYKPDVTSYDYIAPLSEAGDITPKYEVIRSMLKKMVLEPEGITELPNPPKNSEKADYGMVFIDKYLHLEDMITPIQATMADKPMTMEMLNIHNGYGQNYGFILYRAYIRKGKRLSFTVPACDRAQIIVNGKEVGVLYWLTRRWEVDIPETVLGSENILDILVEHHGRVNYVLRGFNRFNQERKGISGDVLLDGQVITNWRIYPLEFKEQYINRIVESHKWQPFTNWDSGITSLYTGTFQINATPKDTFINMKGWTKGNVFINGFNLGRYWKEGPQRTLYVPAPILKPGANKVVIFELHKASNSVTFQDVHVLS